MRRLAAALMLMSGGVHLAQAFLATAPTGGRGGLAVLGALYLLTGALLLRPGEGGLYAGAIFPVVGGLSGALLLRFGLDPLLLFYVAIDVVVFVICVRLLFLRRGGRPAA